MKLSSSLTSNDQICHSAALAPYFPFLGDANKDADNNVSMLVVSDTELNIFFFHGLKDILCMQQTNKGYRCAALDILYL